ncbi:hypothetical protein MM221_06035 [Salipaludibacillus sp. LMS25]|jgi:hypothetical protein|uniref:hypothetical protein n=1 Tax=Salipaludibacillus sp. LMS25 TaxID=2924031 RepID=UPI0020D1A312|nr:hypothetical protein [Salipaludibacillus sp. LMS25]UTR16117.1 hypothetical protein MM221_06035 [Salipaludibacillus sp. LMS25]
MAKRLSVFVGVLFVSLYVFKVTTYIPDVHSVRFQDPLLQADSESELKTMSNRQDVYGDPSFEHWQENSRETVVINRQGDVHVHTGSSKAVANSNNHWQNVYPYQLPAMTDTDTKAPILRYFEHIIVMILEELSMAVVIGVYMFCRFQYLRQKKEPDSLKHNPITFWK